MTPLERLRQTTGSAIDLHVGRTPLEPVAHSRELDRILALPIATITPAQVDAMRRRVGIPGAALTLRDDQARALCAAEAAGGLFAPMSVGSGKTLIAYLLPTVLDRRAVVLTSAGLVAQAERERAKYAGSFLIRGDVTWCSYALLSSPRRMRLLEDLDPGLIIADECQALAHADSARTKRFRRYMRRHPSALFAALSGSVLSRSILDFADLMHRALGDYTPLPRDWRDLREWSQALDVDPTRPAGALRALGTPVRQAWQRRLRSTRGVVVTEGDAGVTAELVIRHRPIRVPPSIVAAGDLVTSTWERPDGEPLTMAIELARVLRQVRLGGYYRWAWPDSVPLDARVAWFSARSAWLRDLREYLRHSAREGADSPALVEAAVVRGDLVVATYAPWAAIRDAVQAPDPEWVWISRRPAARIATRALRRPCVVWTDVVPVGREIARVMGVPWYGAGSACARGILGEDGSRSIVASIRAHGVGRNLQAYSRAIVAGGSPNGGVWEQLLGRLHRPGQLATRVTYDVLFADEARAARDDAKFVAETLGTPQKLLSATWLDF